MKTLVSPLSPLRVAVAAVAATAADRAVSVKMTGSTKDRWAGIFSREEGNAPILQLDQGH